MIPRHWALLLPIMLVLLGSIGAQQQRNEPISVYPSGDGLLVVQVRQASKLYPVLQELCQQTQMQCDITAAADGDEMVAPVTLSGNLSEVVWKLLEGAGFNFVAVPQPSPRGAASLVIQKRPVGNAPNQFNQVVANNTSSPEPPVAAELNEPFSRDSAGNESTDSANADLSWGRSGSAASVSPGASATNSNWAQPAGDVLERFLSGKNGNSNEAAGQFPAGPPLPGIFTQSSVPPGPPLPGVPIVASDGNGPLGPITPR